MASMVFSTSECYALTQIRNGMPEEGEKLSYEVISRVALALYKEEQGYIYVHREGVLQTTNSLIKKIYLTVIGLFTGSRQETKNFITDFITKQTTFIPPSQEAGLWKQQCTTALATARLVEGKKFQIDFFSALEINGDLLQGLKPSADKWFAEHPGYKEQKAIFDEEIKKMAEGKSEITPAETLRLEELT